MVAKSFNPWYFKASEVECFSISDNQYHRLLGTDGHSFRRQVEGFADVILHGIPAAGAGLAAMRSLSAVAQSARTGARVALANAPGRI